MSGAVVILSSSPPRTFARSPTPADTIPPFWSSRTLSTTTATISGQLKDSRQVRDGFSGGFGSARALLTTKVGAENIPLLSPRKDGFKTQVLKGSEGHDGNPLRKLMLREKEVKATEERSKHGELLLPSANLRPKDSQVIEPQGLKTSETEPKDQYDPGISRDSSPLFLEKAIPRRLDWTPVKPNAHVLEARNSEDRDLGFTNDLMAFFAFDPPAITSIETTAPGGTNEAPLHRRRIDLVMTTEADPLPSSSKTKPGRKSMKGGNNGKAKPAAKKALTITGLATSNYAGSRQKETKLPPMLEYLTATQVGAGTEPDSALDKVSKANPSSKKARPNKKAPAKSRLKSPISAMKTALEQQLLFGPASQLARDESPTLTRDTLEALKCSDCFSSDPISPPLTQPVSIDSISPKTSRGTSRYVRRKNLWGAASRDEDNALLHVDTVDLTDSPAVRLALAGKDVLLQPIGHKYQDIDTLNDGSPGPLRGPFPSTKDPALLLDVDEIVTRQLPKSIKPPTQAQARLYHTSRTLKQPQKGAGVHHQADELHSGVKNIAPDSKPTMPSYVGFSDHELKKQISAYGFKAIKKREAMIELLERCWESKHGSQPRHEDENASNDVMTHADLLSKIHDVSARPAPKPKKPSAKRKSESGDTTSTKEPKKRKKTGTKSDDSGQKVGKGSRKRTSMALSNEKIVDIDDLGGPANRFLEKGCSLEIPTVQNDAKSLRPQSAHAVQRLITPPSTVPQLSCTPSQAGESSRAQSTSLTSRLDSPAGGVTSFTPQQTPMPDILSQIHAAIYHLSDTKSVIREPRNHQTSPTWHEKILMYDPIVLEELTVWLNTEGFKTIGEDRERKTRCSGERPECKTCTDNNHVCSGYADRPIRKDGERPDEDVEEDAESGSPTPQKQSRDAEVAMKLRAGPEKETEHKSREDVGEMISPSSNHTGSSVTSSRNRVPYFRYFGPTAIVPGFKQMVVQVKDHRSGLPSASGESPAAGQQLDGNFAVDKDRVPIEIPFYDATDPDQNDPLITHLCETFFAHLGCNYPFLQRDRFLRDLEEKKVDAILVDAVCAVAARFSGNLLLCRSIDPSIPLDAEGNVRRAFRGQPFAQRAMSAVIDTFSCPTMAVAQACLLLAYEEFGVDHDSGLWMYLGTAIRMAQDLGIQKLEGLQLEGRIGPTPKTAKHGQDGKAEEQRRAEQQQKLFRHLSEQGNSQLDDRRASEQERIDTFWAIFFLDRAVSSGVGRPVTLRDKDIEISFPYRADQQMINGYPDPFPAMIKIVHMYGRVADVLNNIKEVSQVTPDVLKRLASMERDLTGIYQRLSPRLHFNATNFQHYVKAGHGTNFILLHFWFHTLIVLLHQPTLLHSFEGRIQQLFPDSRELSMSSAKTIADILAFAELIDVKSFIGNPFTSQPMYVAACAFLAEAAAHTSQPSSRATSPPSNGHTPRPKQDVIAEKTQRAASARHTLLATAANQNYQRCYKALKTLDSYWAGCRYILTALDQKSKGLMDPLLFTADDVDGEMPSTEPSFTTPGWRRSTSLTASLGAYGRLRSLKALSGSGSISPSMDLSNAIGWSLTGTANSLAPNLSFLYPTGGESAKPPQTAPWVKEQDEITQSPAASRNFPAQWQNQRLSSIQANQTMTDTLRQVYHGENSNSADRVSSVPYDPVSTADADLLLGLHSPYAVSSATPSSVPPRPAQLNQNSNAFGYPQQGPRYNGSLSPQQPTSDVQNQAYSDMLIQSQDIDMSAGQQFNFDFPGSDMIPWLEYLPQDVLNYFTESQTEI
ncbi:hypothetical protein AYL99_00088 [Fonsecaea erecta]|uniref:Structure-specific endonuclease subunit SLX4 n=1 Tax=Fonsecaea erecta TaxID=1367422 RepID=A0A178ZXI1_9EURO|nr:hypothetical protein AYL99_00088 [Fonsecaea erecta]OAP64116.1 hypothetical protein AYL99_00088 [Fonsecaea erecta]